jgi:hypothetical protein
VDRYLNLRGTGNVFDYTASNISTNGFQPERQGEHGHRRASRWTITPYPGMGFRLSPGVLLL